MIAGCGTIPTYPLINTFVPTSKSSFPLIWTSEALLFRHEELKWYLHLQVSLFPLPPPTHFLLLRRINSPPIRILPAHATIASLPPIAMNHDTSLIRTSTPNAVTIMTPSPRGNPALFDSKPKSDPMCIICQRSGHRLSECREEVSAKGK